LSQHASEATNSGRSHARFDDYFMPIVYKAEDGARASNGALARWVYTPQFLYRTAGDAGPPQTGQLRASSCSRRDEKARQQAGRCGAAQRRGLLGERGGSERKRRFGRDGGLRRRALHARSDRCIVRRKRGQTGQSTRDQHRTRSRRLPSNLLHSSGSPALRSASNTAGRFGECSFTHLIVIAGLRRRASASSAFASSILPACAWAAPSPPRPRPSGAGSDDVNGEDRGKFAGLAHSSGTPALRIAT
jgi:hypothetical protein